MFKCPGCREETKERRSLITWRMCYDCDALEKDKLRLRLYYLGRMRRDETKEIQAIPPSSHTSGEDVGESDDREHPPDCSEGLGDGERRQDGETLR